MENHMKISIYINKEVEEIIKAKQFDANSRYLDITLLNNDGSPYDLTKHRVQFNAQKADNTYIMNNCKIIEAKEGKVEISLTDQTLAIGDSIAKCDISIFSQNEKEVLTTRTFLIQIQKTIRNDYQVESSNEYNSVISLFQDVWDIREVIYRINERFGEVTDDLLSGDLQAGSSALGALNNIWNYLKTQSTAAIVETVNEMQEALGTTESNKESNTVVGYLKRGLIKYKKYGLVKDLGGGVTVNLDKTVNVDKTMILLNGSGRVDTAAKAFLPHISSQTSTSFTIRCGGAFDESDISYQFFEFY